MEYLKDINLDIDEYGDCLPRQHDVNFKNKLQSVYTMVKGLKKVHEKTVWIISSCLSRLKDLLLPDMMVRDNHLKPLCGK